MNINVVMGLMIPFLGTTLGAACVFFMKKDIINFDCCIYY